MDVVFLIFGYVAQNYENIGESQINFVKILNLNVKDCMICKKSVFFYVRGRGVFRFSCVIRNNSYNCAKDSFTPVISAGAPPRL